MPETESIAIDTSPIIALVAALGNLNVLQVVYSKLSNV